MMPFIKKKNLYPLFPLILIDLKDMDFYTR